MKKIFGLVFIMLFGIVLVSCGNENKDDARYAIYELAKESDYEGTYEEWLESIKGDKIVLSVIDDELKWKYSKDPDTSYKTLVKLSALKGKDGTNGTDGKNGTNGTNGTDGKDGKDGTNGTDGKDGKDGKDAKEIKDISSFKVGDTTIFTFVFNDNSEIKAELVDKKVAIREVKSANKEVNAYKIYQYKAESKYYDIYLDKPEYQLGKVNFRFIENESLVPYISLDEMVKLYNINLTSNDIKSTVEEVDGNSLWTIKNNDVVKATVKIDPINQVFVIDGNFEGIFKNPIDYTRYSLFLNGTHNQQTIAKAENKMVYSYKDTDFQTIKSDGINYYPFGLLNLALQNYTSRKYFYNYVNLYEYNEFEQLNQMEIFKKEGDDTSYMVMDEMKGYIEKTYTEKDPSGNPLMPMYLRLNSRAEFIFMFDNTYGLEITRNIKSMKTYFENYGIYDDLINDNSLIRGKAFSKAAFILEDSHTGKFNTSTTPWGEDNGGKEIEGAHISKLIEERRTLGRNLANLRKATLKNSGFEEDNKNAILYSQDGKTAYFYFDSFDATTNAYKKSGGEEVLKDDAKLAAEDSYFFFVKQLNEIKNHVTIVEGNEVKVKNVVIDDSQNGGGYVYILGKLLALISKDNMGITYTQNDITKEVFKSVYRVDSNKDVKYDADDCYGNYFDFYILTSNQSFSCGNAFPIIASNYKYAKLIGERTGGGECVVDQGLLSNGICYAHSGNEHLIIYDETKKTITGVEDGIAPDTVINYYEYYDIEALNKVIQKLNANA